jgi:alpha-acetolactate decarboxylase
MRMQTRASNQLLPIGLPILLGTICLVALQPLAKTYAEGWDGKVAQYGEMREVLGLGQHEGRVRLGDLVSQPNCLAVGALEQLAGEVTVCDGKIIATLVSATGQPETIVQGAERRKATMLVAAYVPSWKKTLVDHDVTAADFEKFVLEEATKAGLDVSKPFPFKVQGTLADVELHVINGACPLRAERLGQELKKDRQPFRLHSADAKGTIVGIFAQGAEHRLTHHGTNTHMHALWKSDEGQTHTGHIETTGLRKGATLFLPVQ